VSAGAQTKLLNLKQLRKIWWLARQLGLDDDLLHARVKALVGKESLRALTRREAGIVIDDLERLHSNRPGMATKRELWKIRQLEKALGWDDNPKRLRAFLKKYYGVDDVRFLTHAAAWRLIESLKKIREREKVAGDTVG
jgi:hypothetical protein